MQGIVTCWKEDVTLLVTTILNMTNKLSEGRVVVWCDYYLRQDVALQQCTVGVVANGPTMFGREH